MKTGSRVLGKFDANAARVAWGDSPPYPHSIAIQPMFVAFGVANSSCQVEM
jgi:hypothetical protein